MRVIGIDPGQTGALALIDGATIIDIADMPVVDKWVNPTLLHNIITTWHDTTPVDLAVVERVRSMPGQGVASTFKFGGAWGMAIQVVAGITVEQPTPASWKRDMNLTRDKGASRAMAIDLWPDAADRFARVKDDGRAEAALLAEWGRRRLVDRGHT